MIKDGKVIGVVVQMKTPYSYAVPTAIVKQNLQGWGIGLEPTYGVWKDKRYVFNQTQYDARSNYYAESDGEIEVYLYEYPKNKAGSVTIYINDRQAISKRFDTKISRQLSLHLEVEEGDSWQVRINIDSVEPPSEGPEGQRRNNTKVRYREKS